MKSTTVKKRPAKKPRETEVHAPALDATFRIRALPPALVIQLEQRATKNGRLDVNELDVLKFFHAVVDPDFTLAEVRLFFENNGPSVWLVLDRIDAISGVARARIDCRFSGLQRRAIQAVFTANRVLRDRHARARRPPTGAPAATATPRARERRDRTSSPTRAGPSSDDDGPSSEPPSTARPCACGCGRPRRPDLEPPHRYYSSDECRKRDARARKREQRARDQEDPDRVVDREGEVWRPASRCPGCGNAIYFDRQRGTVCLHCGRLVTIRIPASANGSAEDRPDRAVAAILREETRRGAPKRTTARAWRIRPNPKESAKLQKTRNDATRKAVSLRRAREKARKGAG